MSHNRAVFVLFCAAAALPAYAGKCTETQIAWTIYSSYTNPATGQPAASGITGDGARTDSSGNSVYLPASGPVQVTSKIFDCAGASAPSYDAVLNIFKGRSFNVSLGSPLDNVYSTVPPTFSFFNQIGLVNVSDIKWCQNHGFPNGCTFYTALTTQLTGPDGKTYHLRMENPGPGVPVTSWSFDTTANCAYATSPVQVVFTPASMHPSGKDTYVVTPVLQGTNTAGVWSAPPQSAGCPSATLEAGTWPAGVGALILGDTGNSRNYGQYDVPFKFVIQKQ